MLFSLVRPRASNTAGISPAPASAWRIFCRAAPAAALPCSTSFSILSGSFSRTSRCTAPARG